jgi:KRAB domain-containing zinc finger protein
MATETEPVSFPEVKVEPELMIENEETSLSEIESNKSIVKRRKRRTTPARASTIQRPGKFLRLAPDDKPELFKSLTDPYECSFCKERFREIVTLTEHLKKHRTEKWPGHEKTTHPCPICDSVWSNKSRLKRHLINSHYKSSTYKCHHCTVFRTLTKATLEEHLLFRHFDIEQQCPDCEIVLPNRRSYLRHIKTHQLPNQLQCPGCKRCFATPQQYRFHMKTNKTVIGCKQCDAAFHTVRSLDTHMQIVHDWIFTCEVCKLPLANRQNYNIHLRIQHSIHVKPSCKYCAREFESTGEMVAHQKSEHELQNYICETCGKNFKTTTQLNVHVKYKHQINADDVRKVKCDLCGKTLRDKKSVERHIKLIHMNCKPTSKTPKLVYTCPQCPQWKFSRHQHLEGHMVIHNTENRRFFQCFNCGIAYTRRQKFDIHVKKCFAIGTDNN